MTRPLYSDVEFFRRADRGAHMPLSQSPHIHDQYETGSHLSNRTTPSSESDSRAPGGSRKRVPVAVRSEIYLRRQGADGLLNTTV